MSLAMREPTTADSLPLPVRLARTYEVPSEVRLREELAAQNAAYNPHRQIRETPDGRPIAEACSTRCWGACFTPIPYSYGKEDLDQVNDD